MATERESAHDAFSALAEQISRQGVDVREIVDGMLTSLAAVVAMSRRTDDAAKISDGLMLYRRLSAEVSRHMAGG
jgi:hypothetical protein